METNQQPTQHQSLAAIQFGDIAQHHLSTAAEPPSVNPELEEIQPLTLRELVQQSEPLSEPRKRHRPPPLQADGLRYHCPSIFDVRRPTIHLPDLTSLQHQLDKWVDQNKSMINLALYIQKRMPKKTISSTYGDQTSGLAEDMASEKGSVTPMTPSTSATTVTPTMSEGQYLRAVTGPRLRSVTRRSTRSRDLAWGTTK